MALLGNGRRAGESPTEKKKRDNQHRRQASSVSKPEKPTLKAKNSTASTVGSKPTASWKAPRTATKAQPAPPSTEIQKIASLLQQLHRRNANQHGSQKWWKWLNLLRRAVRELARIDQGQLAHAGQALSERTTTAEQVRAALAAKRALDQRKRALHTWVRDTLMARCYVAFSGVVRDAQFAALGVVLVGALASLGKEIGLPEPELEEEEHVRGTGGWESGTVMMARSVLRTGVDRGEVVERRYESDDVGAVVERAHRRRERKRERAILREEDGGEDDHYAKEDAHEAAEIVQPAEGGTHPTEPRDENITTAEANWSQQEREVATDTGNGRPRKKSAASQLVDNTGTTTEDEHRAPPKKSKSKRKKGNAIEDLFAGLA